MSTIQSSNDWTVLTSRYISFFLRLSSILFSLHFTWHRITAILWFGNVSFWARCWHLLHFSFLFALCSFSCHLYAIARATYHVASLCLCLSLSPPLSNSLFRANEFRFEQFRFHWYSQPSKVRIAHTCLRVSCMQADVRVGFDSDTMMIERCCNDDRYSKGLICFVWMKEGASISGVSPLSPIIAKRISTSSTAMMDQPLRLKIQTTFTNTLPTDVSPSPIPLR